MFNQSLHRGAHAQKRQRLEAEDALQRYAEDFLGEYGPLSETYLTWYGVGGGAEACVGQRQS